MLGVLFSGRRHDDLLDICRHLSADLSTDLSTVVLTKAEALAKVEVLTKAARGRGFCF